MSHTVKTQALASALAGEFRAALEVVLGSVVTVSVAPAAPSGRGWAAPIMASGALTGQLTVTVDAAGVQAMAARMTGDDHEPDDATVAGLLRDLWSRAAAATPLKSGFEGLALEVGTPVAADLDAGTGAWVLRAGDQAIATLAVTGLVTVSGMTASPEARAVTEAPGDGPVDHGNLAALLDIDLPLVVRFARTELTLRALTMLGPGSLVDMGRSPDEPVQLLVGSQVIAEGDVVVVGGNYGVRITSLVSPADRLRAMEL